MASGSSDKMIDLTADDESRDEFIVNADKLKLVLGVREKLRNILQVNVIRGDISTDTESRQQWIQLEGLPENRKLAKEYIQTLCNPIEVQPMKYPEELQSVLKNPEVHGPIEQHSKAVIRFEQPGEVMIYGNESLSVTLAYSALEDVISEHLEEAHLDLDTNGILRSGKPKEASHRLTEELKRRLSMEEGNSVEDNDLNLMNDSIKRVILDVLNSRKDGEDDSDTENLEAYGIVPHKPSQADKVKSDGFVSIHDDNSKPQPMEVGPSLGEAAKQLKHIVLDSIVPDVFEKSGPQPDPNDGKGSLSETAKYQKEWALEKGFSEEKINAVFQKHGQDLQFQQFYRLINDITTTEAASEATTSSPRKNASKDSDKPSEAGVKNYIKRLTQDHIEEANVENIDELKERNEERQRLLMKIFEKRKDGEQDTVNVDDDVVESDEVIEIGDTDEIDTGPFRHRGHRGGHFDQQPGMGFQEPHHPYRGHAPKQQHPQQLNPYNQQQLQNRDNPRSRSPVRQIWDKNFQHGRSPSPKRYRDHVNYPSPQRQMGPGGSQAYSGPTGPGPKPNYRYVVIDGSNVAFTHGNKNIFSCRGIQLCIDYFKRRGHTEITAFVPQWRTRTLNHNYPISDQHLLEEMRKSGHLVFTPSRRVPGKNICCYDDRYVLRLAQETEGVIVSNDNYRDLWQEKPEWRDIIENRLLMFSFVADIFMPPDDPLGKDGPTLDEFLLKGNHRNIREHSGGGLSHIQLHNQNQPQPYRQPYRPPHQQPIHQNQQRAWQQPSSRQVFQKPSQQNYHQPQQYRQNQPRYSGQTVAYNRDPSGSKFGPQGGGGGGGSSRGLAVDTVDSGNSWQPVRGGRRSQNRQGGPAAGSRDAKITGELRSSLKDIFTEKEEDINRVLQENPSETDLNTLSEYLLNCIAT